MNGTRRNLRWPAGRGPLRGLPIDRHLQRPFDDIDVLSMPRMPVRGNDKFGRRRYVEDALVRRLEGVGARSVGVDEGLYLGGGGR